MAKVEKLLGVENLYEPSNIEILHHVNQALKAHALFKRDVDYVVKDGEVMIVDEFTGRLMPGRRWSDGLHQAVEAKEGVKIESENQTLATITFQNYFRMYEKLSGMTGTADTEAAEFAEIYKLDVMVIPTNRPMVRKDSSDVIYKTEKEKFKAVIEDIVECHDQGAAGAGRHHLHREVRGARRDAQKAGGAAQRPQRQAPRAGGGDRRPGRAQGGGDHRHQHGRPRHRHHPRRQPEMLAQKRSGHRRGPESGLCRRPWRSTRPSAPPKSEEVLEAGGLYILGTERHESRRIDNQLRGRSGRQGDPGDSRFYLCLEDDLLRIFGSHRVAFVMEKLRIPEGEPIEHRMISKAIENAQKKVEGHNFEIRKHLIEYDDVMNKQREVIYTQRKEVLAGENIRETIEAIIGETVEDMVATFCPEKTPPAEWNWERPHRGFLQPVLFSAGAA